MLASVWLWGMQWRTAGTTKPKRIGLISTLVISLFPENRTRKRGNYKLEHEAGAHQAPQGSSKFASSFGIPECRYCKHSYLFWHRSTKTCSMHSVERGWQPPSEYTKCKEAGQSILPRRHVCHEMVYCYTQDLQTFSAPAEVLKSL